MIATHLRSIHYTSAVIISTSLGRGYLLGGNTGSISGKIDGILFSTETSFALAGVLATSMSNTAGVSSSLKGFVLGGVNAASANSTVVSGFNFNTEISASTSANLTEAKSYHGSFNSSIKGWASNGVSNSSPNSFISVKVDGIIFSTETSATAATGPSVGSGAGSYAAGYQSSLAGYTMGLFLNSLLSTGCKFLFSSETQAVVSSSMSILRYLPTGVTYTGVKGYNLGGVKSGSVNISEIDGMLFSNESTINPSASLATARYQAGGVYSSVSGYALGGQNTASAVQNEIDGIQFATETAINPAASVSLARYGAAGCSAQFDYQAYWTGGVGLVLGGYTASPSTIVVGDISGMNFTTESYIIVQSVLSLARAAMGSNGISGPTYGYAFGGSSVSISSEIDGVSFASGVSTNPADTLPVPAGNGAGVQSTVEGFLLGGATTGGTAISNIQGFTFATEGFLSVSATLAQTRQGSAGVSSTVKGYALGGATNSSIESFTFSTKVANGVLSAGLPQGPRVGFGCGVQSSTAGYVIGGWTGGTTWLNTIERLLFATEGTSNLSATLVSNRGNQAGCSSGLVGYSIGGDVDSSGVPLNEIEGLVLSSETYTNTYAGMLPIKYQGCGVSSPTSYTNGVSFGSAAGGYIAGGILSTGYTATTTNLNFTTETINTQFSASLAILESTLMIGSQSPTSGYAIGANVQGIRFSTGAAFNASVSMPSTRGAGAGFNNVSIGLTFGATTSNVYAQTINGVAFGTETLASTATVLGTKRNGPQGTESPTKGYAISGSVSGVGYIGTTDSYVFASDTSAAIASNAVNGQYGTCCRNSTLGYIASYYGGNTGLGNTEVTRITFSSETFNVASATLRSNKQQSTGVFSSSIGFICGSSDTGNIDIDGINLSTGTSYTVVGSLTQSRYYGAGMSNYSSVALAANGYSMGGYNVSFALTNTIVGLNFSSHTTFSVSATITASVDYSTGISSAIKGFRCGGGPTTSINAMMFSTNSVATLTAVLPVSLRMAGSTGAATINTGYTFGGYSVATSAIGSVQGLKFGTEACYSASSSISAVGGATTTNSPTNAYILGGTASVSTAPSPVWKTTFQWWSFSTETLGGSASGLGYAMGLGAGCSSITKGYQIDGEAASIGAQSRTATILGVVFSTNTVATVSAGIDSTTDASEPTGVSSSAEGFALGGYRAAVSTAINGILFSTETAVHLSAVLTSGKVNGCGVQG